MAYRKTYRKRRTFKKKGWGKKVLGYAGTAVKALAIAKKVADMVNTEYKAQQVTISDTPNTTGSVTTLSLMSQGIAEHERVGDSVKLQRYSGRMSFTQHASATSTIVRMIIFQGKQERGNPYNIGEIIYNGSSTSVISPKNYDQRFNTKIMFDKTYTLSKQGTTVKMLDLNLPLNWHLEYEDNTTSIFNGGLYMVLISNEATNTPTVKGELRLTYTDS